VAEGGPLEPHQNVLGGPVKVHLCCGGDAELTHHEDCWWNKDVTVELVLQTEYGIVEVARHNKEYPGSS
jgi:hypothetical protein